MSRILKSPSRIVVTRLQDVGDMLVFVPFLKTLRNAYPEAIIYLITRNILGHNTIEGCPYVNEVIHAGRGFIKKLSFWKKLRSIKPDMFILSTTEFGKMKWALLSGAKITVGYSNPLIFNREKKIKWSRLLTISPPFDNNKSEIENNLDLLRAIGIKNIDNEMEYSWILKEDERIVDGLLCKAGINKEELIVIISPGTKQKTKEWMPERFAELGDKIIDAYGAKIIISGSSEEINLAKKIIRCMKNQAISLAGRTTLKQLPVLFSRSQAVITTDSGPMHFAAAIGLPYVALFGPGDFLKWAHQDKPTKWKNIYHKLDCSPCDKQKCNDYKCMAKIEAEEVFNEFSLILTRTSRKSQITSTK